MDPEPSGKGGAVSHRAAGGTEVLRHSWRAESVSVQIVASRDDFAERGHPGRSVSPTRESRELTDVSAVGNRCAQDGRAPFRLRLHRAADSTPYHFTYQSHAGNFLRTYSGIGFGKMR